MAREKVHAVVGLTACEGKTGGFSVSTDRVLRIELPRQFTEKDLEVMHKDFQQLAALLKDRPKDMASFFNASLNHKIREANGAAKKLGLREEEFTAEGGGIIWWVVGAVVAADVLFDMRRFGLDLD
jgi:hypothetical protein